MRYFAFFISSFLGWRGNKSLKSRVYFALTTHLCLGWNRHRWLVRLWVNSTSDIAASLPPALNSPHPFIFCAVITG